MLEAPLVASTETGILDAHVDDSANEDGHSPTELVSEPGDGEHSKETGNVSDDWETRYEKQDIPAKD